MIVRLTGNENIHLPNHRNCTMSDQGWYKVIQSPLYSLYIQSNSNIYCVAKQVCYRSGYMCTCICFAGKVYEECEKGWGFHSCVRVQYKCVHWGWGPSSPGSFWSFWPFSTSAREQERRDKEQTFRISSVLHYAQGKSTEASPKTAAPFKMSAGRTEVFSRRQTNVTNAHSEINKQKHTSETSPCGKRTNQNCNTMSEKKARTTVDT